MYLVSFIISVTLVKPVSSAINLALYITFKTNYFLLIRENTSDVHGLSGT